jgi:transketolase
MENHQIIGGLGGAVAESLGAHEPTPLLRLGVEERFGQVGTIDFLMDDYGLTAERMVEKIVPFLEQRR